MANKRVVLGSGKLYVAVVNAVNDVYTIPEDSVLETSENQIGLIQGGATIEYTPSFYTAKDDLGLVSKRILTEEEAILKSGIMTWTGDTLAKLSSTARVTTTEATGSDAAKRTVKIGGSANYDGQNYVIRFVHEDAQDGDIRVTIVGSNESGFEIAFAKDSETVINAEFHAVPHDSEGTLIVYEEEI